MAFAHKNKKGLTYYLHAKDIVLRGSGKKQRIYYFKKSADKNALDEVPAGFTVIEVKRSGLPLLKKK